MDAMCEGKENVTEMLDEDFSYIEVLSQRESILAKVQEQSATRQEGLAVRDPNCVPK